MYLPWLECGFEYWGQDKFILASRGEYVENGDKYLRGRGKKSMGMCNVMIMSCDH